MHITKVVIEGFKSFKEQTTFEFQPGLNVLVGHDEAGKSDLLYAIQFVLAGHQFQQASHMDLVKLLHSSANGVRVKTAYVEIVVDISKDRSPREEGDEIKLRRIITSAKDVYKVNGKSASKDKVMTLQSAKLSKVNPYYITSHQKIREICNSSKEKLCAVFCDIASCLKALQSEEESMRERDSVLLSKERKKKELEANRTRRHELLREISTIEIGLRNNQSVLKKAGSDICQVASKRVFQGLESVWSVVNDMKEEEDFKDMALEYRGLLIEQFECPTEYMIAADAVAKNRLFYHVADTERVAIEIRKRTTEKRLPGHCDFMFNEPTGMSMHCFTHGYFVTDTAKMIISINENTRPGMNLVVGWLYNDQLVLCPTSQMAREVSEKTGLTCVTLDGYVVHSSGDVPDGLFFPKRSRFKIFADYKKAYENEKIQKRQLAEQKKLLKTIESRIKRNEAEFQQMKTSPFQTERKAVQRSFKSLEAEMTFLRNWIKGESEVDPSSSLYESKDLMKELILLKVNGDKLRLLAEKLEKVICLNKKVIEIGLIVDSLKKQSEPAHQNYIKLHRERVLIQRPDMTNINQELSLLKAEIDYTILLVDRAPFHLLDRDDGFSPHSQFIVTTLNPGLLENTDCNIIGLRFDDPTQSSQVFKVSKKEARQYLDPSQEN